jgi:hypothetical protein
VGFLNKKAYYANIEIEITKLESLTLMLPLPPPPVPALSVKEPVTVEPPLWNRVITFVVSPVIVMPVMASLKPVIA